MELKAPTFREVPMKELPLTNDGVTLVDGEDFEFSSQWNWRSLPKGHIIRYTKRKGECFYFHKKILKFNYGYLGEVDHKNRIPWDNRKANLRPADKYQNAMNHGLQSNNTSGYKGVYYNTGKRKYYARIYVRTVCIFLGCFTTPIEAAKAYDVAAKRYHKEFAFLNFPENPCS